MARIPKAEMAERVRTTAKILLAGGTFDDVVAFGRQHGWSRNTKQLKTYIARAYKYLASHERQTRHEMIARHVTQRRMLFARAYKDGDLRTALHILRDEAQLLGLYPKAAEPAPAPSITINAIGDVQAVTNISDDALIEARGLALRLRQLTSQAVVTDVPASEATPPDAEPEPPA